MDGHRVGLLGIRGGAVDYEPHEHPGGAVWVA